VRRVAFALPGLAVATAIGVAACAPPATHGILVTARDPSGVVGHTCTPANGHADTAAQPLGPELWFVVQHDGGDADYTVVVYEQYQSLIPPHPSRAKWRPAMGLGQPPPDASKRVLGERRFSRRFGDAALRDSIEIVHEGRTYRLDVEGLPASRRCEPHT
jgi:hypothetical protein